MSISSGSPIFDTMLDGGYPEERAVLLTGTLGTGKKTLTMQFFQGDQLFVLDALGVWENRYNVFNIQQEDSGIRNVRNYQRLDHH